MVAGVVVLVLGAGSVVARMITVDPFAHLRSDGSSAGFDLNLGRFQFKAYQGGKEVASAQVEKGTIFKNTRTVDMQGVSNGVMTTEDGEKLQFNAPAATYDINTKDTVAPLGVQLKTKDGVINAPSMKYDANRKVVTAPGQLKGTIGEGVVTGQNMTMDVAKKTVKIGDVTYEGKVKVADQQDQEWKISADEFESAGKNKTLYTKCKAVSEDQIIYADKVEYDRTNEVLVATGNVRTYGKEANVVSDKATIKRKESRALFEGTVTMMVKPENDTAITEVPLVRMSASSPDSVGPTSKPVGKNDPDRPKDEAIRDQDTLRKYPAVVRADKIDYVYKEGSRHADITGSPMGRQEIEGRWRMLWADSGDYNGETKRLTLKSSTGRRVRARTSLGDDLRAVTMVVSTKKDDDYMKATDSEGVVRVSQDDVPKKDGG